MLIRGWYSSPLLLSSCDIATCKHGPRPTGKSPKERQTISSPLEGWEERLAAHVVMSRSLKRCGHGAQGGGQHKTDRPTHLQFKAGAKKIFRAKKKKKPKAGRTRWTDWHFFVYKHLGGKKRAVTSSLSVQSTKQHCTRVIKGALKAPEPL